MPLPQYHFFYLDTVMTQRDIHVSPLNADVVYTRNVSNSAIKSLDFFIIQALLIVPCTTHLVLKSLLLSPKSSDF